MNTVPGGIYKDAVGDGYHDCNGNPVDAPKEPSLIEKAETALDELEARERAEQAQEAALLARLKQETTPIMQPANAPQAKPSKRNE